MGAKQLRSKRKHLKPWDRVPWDKDRKKGRKMPGLPELPKLSSAQMQMVHDELTVSFKPTLFKHADFSEFEKKILDSIAKEKTFQMVVHPKMMVELAQYEDFLDYNADFLNVDYWNNENVSGEEIKILTFGFDRAVFSEWESWDEEITKQAKKACDEIVAHAYAHPNGSAADKEAQAEEYF